MSHKRKQSVVLHHKENLQLKTENDSIDDEHFAGRNGESLRMGDGDMSGDEVSTLWGNYHHIKKQSDAQNESLQETSSMHDETSSSGNKEDEDDDDDEVDEKMDSQQYDSERLKAFNMFVRLFVDENLDRIIPISKQPKEKIQAIIDSCTRQFPEFAERARKRIRTYLKSCRRNKRSSQPWEQPTPTRPTPAHLTSVAAEQILAQACENESHNAKRMRLGLEPVAQPMPPSLQQQQQQQQDRQQERQLQERPQTQMVTEQRDEVPSYPNLKPIVHNNNNSLSVEQLLKTNGSTGSSTPASLYRPNFSQAFQRAGPGSFPGPPQALFHPQSTFNPATLLPGAPTDLSMKQKPLLNHKLNGAEMAAVRQLITGYRESAAFLLRSADELEQLLLQQQ